MKWFLKVLKQYSDFSTRARRKEYWMYSLFLTLFSFVVMFLDTILGLDFNMYDASLGYGWLYTFFSLATILPSLAVSVRRLHDIGKSGKMLFIIFIPLIGAIWLLVLTLKDSHQEKINGVPIPKKFKRSSFT